MVPNLNVCIYIYTLYMRAVTSPQYLLRGGYKQRGLHPRLKAGKDIMDALVHLRKKKGAEDEGKQPEESRCWRRRFGACFMLTMPESSRNHPSSRARKMMGVIVVVCAAFGLTHRIEGQDCDHVFTCEGDAGVHRHIQRRGSGPGV